MEILETKRCMKCGQLLPLDGFYRHPAMGDGRLNKCKTCTKRDVKENRAKREDYYREKDRIRASTPKSVAARNAYRQTEAGKAAVRKAKKKYDSSPKKVEAIRRHRAKHPVKYAARSAVGAAIKAGVLTRNPCEACGNLRAHAHHDDYSKPLDVRWLCTTHHAEWHRHNTPICPDQEQAA